MNSKRIIKFIDKYAITAIVVLMLFASLFMSCSHKMTTRHDSYESISVDSIVDLSFYKSVERKSYDFIVDETFYDDESIVIDVYDTSVTLEDGSSPLAMHIEKSRNSSKVKKSSAKELVEKEKKTETFHSEYVYTEQKKETDFKCEKEGMKWKSLKMSCISFLVVLVVFFILKKWNTIKRFLSIIKNIL